MTREAVNQVKITSNRKPQVNHSRGNRKEDRRGGRRVKRFSSREVEIKTEPSQEERNREQREGPPNPQLQPTSAVQYRERERES